jgi:glycosyltransferase involved in cell wall biosynthesis
MTDTPMPPMRTALDARFVGQLTPQAEAARSRDTAESLSTECNRPIRLLVFTSLYPNVVQPRHGIFVEERLRHLIDSGRVSATVVAPVPWFPFRHPRFGRYAQFARIPVRERRHGITILHPRYPVIPKIGMNVAPMLMYRALLPVLRRLVVAGDFGLIDAHYFYPDGAAAVKLGAAIGRPVVITARGSDLNVIAAHHSARRQIELAAANAAAVVTVSESLKRRAQELGIQTNKLSVLRNGVDLDSFRLLDRCTTRTHLGLTGTVWLVVGNLVEPKGVHLTLAALAEVVDAVLIVAGDGPEMARLRELAHALGVDKRVRFLGSVPHTQLVEYYNAADALFLASSREGMPNVVLEALACGTPVVATPFDSAAELLTVPDAGEIAGARTADAIVAAWRRLDHRRPARAATRRHAESLGWAPVVDAQCALYARVVQSSAPVGACT